MLNFSLKIKEINEKNKNKKTEYENQDKEIEINGDEFLDNLEQININYNEENNDILKKLND